MQFAKEGEELSKKQLALESSAKKLRAQQKEGDLARKDLETKLLMEQQKVSPASTLMLQICQHSCLAITWTARLSIPLHAAISLVRPWSWGTIMVPAVVLLRLVLAAGSPSRVYAEKNQPAWACELWFHLEKMASMHSFLAAAYWDMG